MLARRPQTIEALREFVKAGVELLDANISDWYTQIDLEMFHISDCFECIMGQLFGGFTWGLTQLGIIDEDAEYLYGFDCHSDDYDKLTGIWKDTILAKRAK